MKPSTRSNQLLSITRSKAKMYEYGVPIEDHIAVTIDPANLFDLTIGILGDLTARINNPIERIDEDSSESKQHIKFSAFFFDSYIASRLNSEVDAYLQLLASAAYYLSDFPGSSAVLAKQADLEGFPSTEDELVKMLRWMLAPKLSAPLKIDEPNYGELISSSSLQIFNYLTHGVNGSAEEILRELRAVAYRDGSPRDVLMADAIAATAKMRISNSIWNCLPNYSGINVEKWRPAFEKSSFIREFWPAQNMIGENRVFEGTSAVIQMPTSAGKTKSTELIIRSAFLSDRASLAVIVAPLRALCHEIHDSLIEHFSNEAIAIDELSDVVQDDFVVNEFLGRKQVIIVTPEKLSYVFRQEPDFASQIGLIIYDEGHLIDDENRGPTYELLLSSLKSRLPTNVQIIFISAVLQNSSDIRNWLMAVESPVISGKDLSPTYRTIAFTSWVTPLGRLQFISPNNPDKDEYFVPRVLSQHKLKLLAKEKDAQLFPKKNPHEIALYLALRLHKNGSVAIFCAQKKQVANLCKIIVDVYKRGLDMNPPSVTSDNNEWVRLQSLYARNLGSTANATVAAIYGFYTHHGNIPQGIRLAVEWAMKKGLIKIVICTSSLAQGVNLPLRYLVIDSARIDRNLIKTREFQNLIGRAGRLGMHTEGSIIFADPKLYDNKLSWQGSQRWREICQLLDVEQSEDCNSGLLLLTKPIIVADDIAEIGALNIITDYIGDFEEFQRLPERITSINPNLSFDAGALQREIDLRLSVITAVESHLLSYIGTDATDREALTPIIDSLLTNTFAYELADDTQKNLLIEIFILLAQNLFSEVDNFKKRVSFGKTLLGIQECMQVENWVTENIDDLANCTSDDELLAVIWPLLSNHIKNNNFQKCSATIDLAQIANGWISGVSFGALFSLLNPEKDRIGRFKPTIDHIVDICQNALGFDGALVVGALTHVLTYIDEESHSEILKYIQRFQKRLKYGLPEQRHIQLFEMAFSDRPLALEIGTLIESPTASKSAILAYFEGNKEAVTNILNKYPAYFTVQFDQHVSS